MLISPSCHTPQLHSLTWLTCFPCVHAPLASQPLPVACDSSSSAGQQVSWRYTLAKFSWSAPCFVRKPAEYTHTHSRLQQAADAAPSHQHTHTGSAADAEKHGWHPITTHATLSPAMAIPMSHDICNSAPARELQLSCEPFQLAAAQPQLTPAGT